MVRGGSNAGFGWFKVGFVPPSEVVPICKAARSKY